MRRKEGGVLVEPEVVYPLCLPVEGRWAQLHAYGALTLVKFLEVLEQSSLLRLGPLMRDIELIEGW